jgi:hypothetical protein
MTDFQACIKSKQVTWQTIQANWDLPGLHGIKRLKGQILSLSDQIAIWTRYPEREREREWLLLDAKTSSDFARAFWEDFADGKNLQGILEKGMPMSGVNLFPKNVAH